MTEILDNGVGMEKEDAIRWIEEVIDKLPEFAERMRGEKTPGFYRYSWSGDLLPEGHWGIGNTVFAAKILYMLNQLTPEYTDEMAKFILSFQGSDGSIYDPMIKRKSRLSRLKRIVLSQDTNNLFYEQTRRAETRQAFAALRCLNSMPRYPYLQVPGSKEEIKRYIDQLNWNQPWDAGSHVSHLAFFLNMPYAGQTMDDLKNKSKLSEHLFFYCNKYRQSDGSWFSLGENVSNQFKVNGSMKMVTAYQAAGKADIGMEKELIDLCLSAANYECACDQFNIICVLNQCIQNTDYRHDEIEMFALKRLRIYKEYYWPKYGGFSFLKGKANMTYYDACLSKGLPEPDIHGTVLFLWGIVLVAEILDVADKFNLRRPIT